MSSLCKYYTCPSVEPFTLLPFSKDTYVKHNMATILYQILQSYSLIKLCYNSSSYNNDEIIQGNIVSIHLMFIITVTLTLKIGKLLLEYK